MRIVMMRIKVIEIVGIIWSAVLFMRIVEMGSRKIILVEIIL